VNLVHFLWRNISDFRSWVSSPFLLVLVMYFLHIWVMSSLSYFVFGFVLPGLIL
jgi:hypothetical protein